jgi:4-diphosphocytidyl-2-C-methyl-D-erythritol kinase
LHGLVQLWDLHIEDRALHSIALSLGADVPVCLLSESAWMEGVGERVAPVSGLPEFYMVLINPRMAVSTARIFGALKDRTGVGQTPKPKNIRDCASLVNYLRNTSNDLETPARAEAPVINDVLNALSLNGAMFSRMSGSGATCFGLFTNKNDADKAAASISHANPKWWVHT